MTKQVTFNDMRASVGTEVGVSDWIEITQDMINRFADVTFDHQFIHVDVEKAKLSPFKTTIAHGFLTVSLLSAMAYSGLPDIKGRVMGVNYGFNKLRLVSPVPSGARVRARFTLKAHDEKLPKQHTFTFDVTVEVEGSGKPALVAEWVTLSFEG
ncbi:MAG TPA: MaoC family dehydratase [Beijerinckiaceae bacterium]|nr:MaoC family dehydratase [Beijerinckiaceae bacterium]